MMGTSKGYSAPTSGNWPNLKRQVTTSAKKGPSSNITPKQILRNYIAANGGARRMATGRSEVGGSRASQGVAKNIANFLSSVATRGFKETLREAGLEHLEGKSVSEITNSLLDYLGGPASTIDESDARNALSNLFNQLFEDAEDQEDVERILEEQSDSSVLGGLLLDFFGYYLYEQFCRVFYERLTKSVGEDNAESYLDNIEEYIESELRDKIYDKDIESIDWTGDEGKIIADEILQGTLEVFGS